MNSSRAEARRIEWRASAAYLRSRGQAFEAEVLECDDANEAERTANDYAARIERADALSAEDGDRLAYQARAWRMRARALRLCNEFDTTGVSAR